MTTGVTPIEYTWREGFVTKIDPTVAGRELERIAKRDQEVVPLTLVEESRPVDAPLHDTFEWDDSEAAERYREDQAKRLIGALKVVFVRNDTEEPLPPMRAYVSVVDTPRLEMYESSAPKLRHYRPIVKVMSTEDLRDQYRRQAFDTLCGWRDRYADIDDFARIFKEIDALKVKYAAG
jgi:hypothetical protein